MYSNTNNQLFTFYFGKERPELIADGEIATEPPRYFVRLRSFYSLSPVALCQKAKALYKKKEFLLDKNF